MFDYKVSLVQVGIKTTAQEHLAPTREELLHRQDMGPTGLLSRLCHHESPEGRPSDGRGKRSKGLGAGILIGCDDGPLPLRHSVIHQRTDVPGLVGEGSQMHGDGRVFVRKPRQQGRSDAHPSKAGVLVAAIADEAQAVVLGVGVHVFPTAVDEGTNHAVLPRGGDAGHATDPRAAQQSVEDRLRLVVEGVPHGDAIRTDVTGQGDQRGVTRVPRRALERVVAGIHVHGEPMEGQPQIGREGLGHGHVVLRLGAQSVIDARHRDANAQLRGCGCHRMGQPHGVGAAGASHQHMVTGCEKRSLPHAPLERCENRWATVSDQNEPERTGT